MTILNLTDSEIEFRWDKGNNGARVWHDVENTETLWGWTKWWLR